MSILAPAKIGINFGYTYGLVYGGGSGAFTGTGDWTFARGASPSFPLTAQVTSNASALEWTDTDHANFNDQPVWVYVPLMKTAGYPKAVFSILNFTGVNCSVTPYLVAENSNLLGVGPLSAGAFVTIGGSNNPVTLSYSGSGTGFSKMDIAVGMTDDNYDDYRIVTDWIGGGLLVSIDPASDPAGGGNFIFHCWRSR